MQWLMARALLVSESIRVGRHKADRQTGALQRSAKASHHLPNGNVFVYERIGGYLLLFYVYRFKFLRSISFISLKESTLISRLIHCAVLLLPLDRGYRSRIFLNNFLG